MNADQTKLGSFGPSISNFKSEISDLRFEMCSASRALRSRDLQFRSYRRASACIGGCSSLTRGAILLEVLVSLALLIFGLAVVGLQVNQGLEAARQAERGTKAIMLADTKLAELQAGVVKPENNNDEIKGNFGLLYPGYTWRFKFKPTEVKDFLMVTLDIGYSSEQAKVQQNNADQETDIESDDV